MITMKWTAIEDATVTEAMLNGIENRVALRTVAENLSQQINHSSDAILRRWYTELSDDGHRVENIRQKKVSVTFRLDTDTIEQIKAQVKQQGLGSQGELIEILVRNNGGVAV